MLKNRMLRLMILFLVVGIAVGNVSAAEEEAAFSGPVLYLYIHPVTHYQYGTMQANDHLNVKRRDQREMVFLLTTLGDEYHECLVEGKAGRTTDGKYEYRQGKCRMVFDFGRNDVNVQITGANGAYCRVDDLDKGHRCGFNTRINSGIYKKAKTMPR